ncbi:MAG: hypothetical protein WEA56_17025 [Balneolaceae bacterium]
MEKITKKDIEWLLNLHKEESPESKPAGDKSASKKILLKAAIAGAGLFALVILPFFLLVRTSVFLNLAFGLPGWLSLGGGIAATVLLLMVYIILLSRNIQNKQLFLKFSLGGITVTVLGFCLFSLFYLSGVNAKSSEVRDLYRSMHPVLRVAVSVVTLADGDLVITDIERIPDDYETMSLPVNPNSLHYRQESGYVHAVDLRTLNRGLIRNALLRGSLELMGFHTLRHTGTADHLHVEMRMVN